MSSIFSEKCCSANRDQSLLPLGCEAPLNQADGINLAHPDAALLVMERTSCFTDGRCCDHTTFSIRPERYAFVLSGVFKPYPGS